MDNLLRTFAAKRKNSEARKQRDARQPERKPSRSYTVNDGMERWARGRPRHKQSTAANTSRRIVELSPSPKRSNRDERRARDIFRQRSPPRRANTNREYGGSSQARDRRYESRYDPFAAAPRRKNSTRRSKSPVRRRRQDSTNDRELAERMAGFGFREPSRYDSKVERIYEID